MISPGKSESMVSSLPILISSISFSSLIATASVSCTILNRGDDEHPCFTLNLIENDSKLSPLQMMLVNGLRYILFINFRKGPLVLYIFSEMNDVGNFEREGYF